VADKTRPVRVIVPFAAGGSTDTVARVLAEKLGTRLGQPVVVENRAGAGGIIGTELAARSPADGYTLLVGTSSTMAIAPHLYSKLSFDPARDFVPVVLLGTADVMVVVNTQIPARTVGELLAYARANPGKLTFGSAGNGSFSHLIGEYFKSMTGVNLLHVPYKGDGPMVIDLMAGQINTAFTVAVGVMPALKSGKVVAIAVTNPKRSTLHPQLPTVSESGAEGYDAIQWFGIAAPRGTPRDVVNRLNSEIRAVLAMPEVTARFAELGFEAVGNTPEEFAEFLAKDSAKWKKIAEIAGTKLD
jgi:tripartite-type tricarboxylate transporter receptor subunit TctC